MHSISGNKNRNAAILYQQKVIQMTQLIHSMQILHLMPIKLNIGHGLNFYYTIPL